ncbi:MAG: PhoH family protein [Candidatus Krumholzibacteria bacterium]|jgi:phosphate starvation-inducible PhoH-like protein|nr:PhoH family protein [Candidatus Krumholzibacteria bacterium]MDP6670109.1 PhoH family protein [Candidatus Krumholzibacteria bacterium]MDP6796510.1 PhoH family protein [Candidatus Krumholzibacteria bacterium]MDP7021925.1 PhoH family protein [Candidatus Krumholzibacteria bacterium]
MPKEHQEIVSIADIDALNLLGVGDSNLRILEGDFPGRITVRGDKLTLTGSRQAVEEMRQVILDLMELIRSGRSLSDQDVHYALGLHREQAETRLQNLDSTLFESRGNGDVKPKTYGQKLYAEAMQTHEMVFAIGPAGTGKTYLAVAYALNLLRSREVERLILVRPAVEAGESLGFLPGDLQEKINPYIQPLQDALVDLVGNRKTRQLMESGVIEAIPLAYMRGRTLNSAFVILDEAQNTTSTQMKMFLTRLGSGSRAVITGDITQIDLDLPGDSGLVQARKLLSEIEGISFVTLDTGDVVRHHLVRKIIEAFEDLANKGEQ